MTTIDSPNNIDILLHFYCTLGVPHPRQGAPAVDEAIKEMVDDGVLRAGATSFQITNLGRAWVTALCSTPKPKLAYVDSNGNMLLVPVSY